MPKFSTSRRVNHSSDKMYELVADIERYPEFVPLCDSLTIQSKEQVGQNEIVLADMTVAYKLLKETFTSHVSMNFENKEIITRAVEGPFKMLENRWSFKPVNEGQCDVDFSISYEFKTLALQFLVGGLFEKVFSKFARAFEERANAIYGVDSK